MNPGASIGCPQCKESIGDEMIGTTFITGPRVAIEVECINCGARWIGSISIAEMDFKPESDPEIKL